MEPWNLELWNPEPGTPTLKGLNLNNRVRIARHVRITRKDATAPPTNPERVELLVSNAHELLSAGSGKVTDKLILNNVDQTDIFF